MLFRRRTPPTFAERVRTWMWPRTSWSRSMRYFLLRLERLKASPHQVALGCAAGVFAAVTPLLGTQMLLAAVIAFGIRASVPAALIGTFFGNPVSWPLIWGGTYFAGCYMLGIDTILNTVGLDTYFAPLTASIMSASPEMLTAAVNTLWPVFKPMLVGSIPLGLASAVVIYYSLRPVVSAYQRSRGLRRLSPAPTPSHGYGPVGL